MVYKLKHRETNIVVFSSSDCEDGNESEIDVQSILLRSIALVLLLNHIPSQDLESGIQQKVGRNLSLVRV